MSILKLLASIFFCLVCLKTSQRGFFRMHSASAFNFPRKRSYRRTIHCRCFVIWPLTNDFYNVALAGNLIERSISPTFYEQLLRAQIPKVQKDSKFNQLFVLLGSACIKAARKYVDEIDLSHREKPREPIL